MRRLLCAGLLALPGCVGVDGEGARRPYFSRIPREPTVADRWTTLKIKGKLAADFLVDERTLRVETIGGVVTLYGIAPSRRARRRAAVLARETEGVRRVINRMRVVRPPRR